MGSFHVQNCVQQRKVKDLDVEWRYYAITKGDSRYEASSKPLNTIRKALAVLNVFLLFSCGATMFLLLKSQQQSRRLETGVFLSIGLSRLRVAAQFMAEALALLACAFCISIWIAPHLAKWFSDQALSAALTMSRVSTDSLRVEISMTTAETLIHSAASLPEEITTNIKLGQSGAAGIAAACVVVISATLAFLPILRMKPIDILKMSR